MSKLLSGKVKRGLALFLAMLMLIGSKETALVVSAASDFCKEAVSDVISEPEVKLDFTNETLEASEVTGVEVVSEQRMKEITGEAYPVDNPTINVNTVSENESESLQSSETDINKTITDNMETENTISENDTSENTISENDTSEDKDDDAIVDIKEGFSIHAGKIMYGEDGSNVHGNLDSLFSPVWNFDGTILTSPETSDSSTDYHVSYKFSLKPINQETVNTWSVEQFHKFESIKLESVDAGTTITVIAMAQLKEDPAICSFATDTFKICKREVYVKLNSNPEICVDSKELSEDGMLSIPAASEYKYISIETVSDNATSANTNSVYALSRDTLEPENAVTGNVLIDITKIDTSVDGYQVFPVSMTFTEDFNKNYVVLGNIWGEVYTQKAHYYMTFTGKSNGESRTVTIDITSYTNMTVREILIASGEYENVFPTLGGLIDESRKESIASWQVHLDGSAEGEYDFVYDEYYDEYYYDDYDWSSEQIQNYIINETGIKHDYFFVAKVMKYAADGLYITSIPEVYYDGRAHLVLGSWTNTKDKVSDIDLHIYSTEEDEYGYNYELQHGTDYTVSYKNNKNATMKLDEEGRYVSIITDDKKRPTLIIKGKGRYKGFSAEIYFDILPRNLGQYEYGNYSSSEKAEISGIKYSYALVNGQIKGKITPKVTKKYYCYQGPNRIDTLKEGKDYIAKLYRWNENGSYWEKLNDSNPNKINRSGDYLYTIWGIGNYCGSVYGSSWEFENEFDDGKDSGTPNPVHLEHTQTYSGESYQFYVSDGDAYWDIANTTITISKPTIKYDGKSHTAKDFGLKVEMKSKGQTHILTEGVDYKLELTDYRAYTYESDGNTWLSHKYYTSATEGPDALASIRIANTYSVKITALGDKFYGYKNISNKLRISGITPKKSYFKIVHQNVDFDTDNFSVKWTLTPAARKAGLTYSHFSTYTDGACNATPGTHSLTLYAEYDGVDHDVSKEATLYWKRKKIDLKTAVKRGYISFSADAGTYNTKGGYPESINVKYRTYETGNRTIYMNYNGQSNTIYIPVGDSRWRHNEYTPLTLKLTVSNNTKVGEGAKLTLKASGLYSGSYTLPYTIKVDELSETTIPVVTSDTYLIMNNKKTSYIQSGTLAEGGYVNEGSIVAKVIDGNLSKGATIYNPKVELYQAYYKNSTDFYNGRLSLARIRNDYFKAIAESEGGNTTHVRIANNGHSYFAGVNYGDNVYVGTNYSVYEQAVTVVGATVTYNGKEYIFQKNSKVNIPYEGRQIRFDRGDENGITSITVQLPDKTQIRLHKDDFKVFYDVNTSSGTNTGSFTIILQRNESNGTYKYGGSGQFKFSITDSDKIIL